MWHLGENFHAAARGRLAGPLSVPNFPRIRRGGFSDELRWLRCCLGNMYVDFVSFVFVLACSLRGNGKVRWDSWGSWFRGASVGVFLDVDRCAASHGLENSVLRNSAQAVELNPQGKTTRSATTTQCADGPREAGSLSRGLLGLTSGEDHCRNLAAV